MDKLYAAFAVFIASAIGYYYYTNMRSKGVAVGNVVPVASVSPVSPIVNNTQPSVVDLPPDVVTKIIETPPAISQPNSIADRPSTGGPLEYIPDVAVPTPTTVATPAAISAPVHDPITFFTRLPLLDFPFNDISYSEYMPHDDCPGACIQQPGCVGYTLQSEPGRTVGCWLKSKLENKTADNSWRDSYGLTSYLNENPI
jgi:hypothetical protein